MSKTELNQSTLCTVYPVGWQTHRDLLRKIRDEVFIQEQQVPIADEWDGKDETAVHFLASSLEGDAIGCARVLVEQNLLHIGRVAVLAEYRNKEVGRQLMNCVLEWCLQQHSSAGIYLHAQTTRIEFYKHLGFETYGDIFLDAGIEHIEMWYHDTRANHE